jgi:hypothetical protein
MKKYIFLQFIVILILLFVWNFVHLIYENQLEKYEQSLSDFPMILTCSNAETLQNLQIYTNSLNYVKSTSFESDSLLKQQILSRYQIESAGLLLDQISLPAALKIYFQGSQFDRRNKRDLDIFLNTSYPEINIIYNQEFWQHYIGRIDFLNRIFFYSRIFLAIFIIVTMVFLRFHFESGKNHYWQIFRAAGGSKSRRAKQYFLHSLWLCLLPPLINYSACLAARHYDFLSADYDYLFFVSEFLLLCSAAIFARLLMGKKF